MADGEKVLRVTQLDVIDLDEELSRTFESEVFNILQSLPSYASLMKIKPEIKVFVRVVIWWLSIRRCGYTFGQEMMGLHYSRDTDASKSNSLATKHLLLSVTLLRWIDDRYEEIFQLLPLSESLNIEWIRTVLLSVFRVAQCINMCLFMLQGVYPSLKERLLRLKMVPVKRQTLRQPSYEFMNREIIWYGFSELLFFVLPMINFFAVCNYFRKLLTSLGVYNTVASVQKVSVRYECSRCKSEPPVIPQAADDCNHIYCYYCISANLMADKEYPCDICGHVIHGFKHDTYR